MSLADNRIDDRDIGPLWVEHFSRIGERPGSKVIVLALVYIIEDKARAGAVNGNWTHRISQEIRRHGILADQFWEIHSAASR